MFLYIPFSNADTWESVYSYYSTSLASAKSVVRQDSDGKNITKYAITQADLTSACADAKAQGNDTFDSVKITYQNVWPDSQFKVVFGDSCQYNGLKQEYPIKLALLFTFAK